MSLRIDTTLGYCSVGETKRWAAKERLVRHIIDNRGTVRPLQGEQFSVARLHEPMSWVAVPMGECAKPVNVKAV